MKNCIIEVPIPMPTRNVLLASGQWKQKKIRDLIHEITNQSILHSNVNNSLIYEYLCKIRTSKKIELSDNFIDNNLIKFEQKVDIHIHSIRKRLVDPDGISAKAFIDAVVRCGYIVDDSSKYVNSVTFSQEKSQVEKTIMIISEMEIK